MSALRDVVLDTVTPGARNDATVELMQACAEQRANASNWPTPVAHPYAAFDVLHQAEILHDGHGRQKATAWRLLVFYVGDFVRNDAPAVLELFDYLPNTDIIFLVSRATMAGLHDLRPGIRGLHAVLHGELRVPPDLPQLQDRAVVVVVDVAPASHHDVDLASFLPVCARGCALLWYNHGGDAASARVPLPRSRWSSIQVRPDGALVALQHPAVGPAPPASPPRPRGVASHRQPGRAAKRARRTVRYPVPNLSAVRDMNRPDLQDCQGLRVVPNPGDPQAINLMDWPEHGAPTAVYAPGPRYPHLDAKTTSRADHRIDETKAAPIKLWGDAQSTNPGGACAFDDPDKQASVRLGARNTLTPVFDRELVKRGALVLQCYVGSVHYWTVQRVRYPSGAVGVRCVAARDLPRGTVLASYGGSLIPKDKLTRSLQPYAMDAARYVASTQHCEDVPHGHVLVAQRHEVGTTMHFMDSCEDGGHNVGVVGADASNSCPPIFVSLGIARGEPMLIQYGYDPTD